MTSTWFDRTSMPIPSSVVSPGGDVATVGVLLSAAQSDEDNAAAVEELRQAAQTELPAGLQAQVTGAPGLPG